MIREDKGIINIRLYDQENYQYPIIQIKEEGMDAFKKILKKYQKSDSYNIDDFIQLIEAKKWFVDAVYCDVDIYF